MFVSQVMLTLFLAYWIYNQFNEKKDLLSTEIKRGLRQAEELVIDSMLVSDIINPLLIDTCNHTGMHDTTIRSIVKRPIKMEVSFDSIPDKILNFSNDTQHIKDQIFRSEFVLHDFDSIPINNMESSITVHASSDSGSRILFQGVKLLINTVGNLDGHDKNIYAFLSSDLDTLLLERTFNEYITTNYGSFDIKWTSISEEVLSNNSGPLVFKSFMFESPYGVEVSNFTVFLLKSIISQISFALILLIITGAAFRMSFLNLKKQMKLNTIKSDFISNITHELKTPVSTVKVALEALLDYNQIDNPERTKEYLEMAYSEMDRLDLLVNNVLGNSSIEEGKTFVIQEDIEIIPLLQNIIQSKQTEIKKANAKIDLQYNDEKITAWADELHLHGVVANLIDNSLKYCEKVPEISIKAVIHNKSLEISVSDNGIGIPEEYLDNVFDKFFRVPTGNKHSVKGYGLGLNYASIVIKQHGGTILVSKNKNGGTTFTIILPDNR